MAAPSPLLKCELEGRRWAGPPRITANVAANAVADVITLGVPLDVRAPPAEGDGRRLTFQALTASGPRLQVRLPAPAPLTIRRQQASEGRPRRERPLVILVALLDVIEVTIPQLRAGHRLKETEKRPAVPLTRTRAEGRKAVSGSGVIPDLILDEEETPRQVAAAPLLVAASTAEVCLTRPEPLATDVAVLLLAALLERDVIPYRVATIISRAMPGSSAPPLLPSPIITPSSVSRTLPSLLAPAVRPRRLGAVAEPSIEELSVIAAEQDRQVPHEAGQLVPVRVLDPAERTLAEAIPEPQAVPDEL